MMDRSTTMADQRGQTPTNRRPPPRRRVPVRGGLPLLCAEPQVRQPQRPPAQGRRDPAHGGDAEAPLRRAPAGRVTGKLSSSPSPGDRPLAVGRARPRRCARGPVTREWTSSLLLGDRSGVGGSRRTRGARLGRWDERLLLRPWKRTSSLNSHHPNRVVAARRRIRRWGRSGSSRRSAMCRAARRRRRHPRTRPFP